MLTFEQMRQAAAQVAKHYPLTKVSVFGSYANGKATEGSDLDLLVEFTTDAVSLLEIVGVKYDFEDLLNTPVDVLHAPLPEDALITVDKEIPIYG
ncbi:MAG: nucleotidyltransferase domain-containing protein [Lachnospiraceae bacterium]|jgi:predicted nucleotidyltransferase|nr:nucleotidyltransferase domain-containing protein [Lachnospiraceae bacterium]